jgi:alpha-tubulin suppressor-like RCC1 family protein
MRSSHDTTSSPLTITPASPVNLLVDQTQQLTVTQNKQPATVTWSISDSSIARVNSSGVVTGVKAGSVTVTATLSSDLSQTSSVVVLVSSGGITENGDFKAIAAGKAHSLALKNDGIVIAWGDNSYGQSTIPSDLNGVTAIAAGFSHSLALKEDGTVIAWGDNSDGQSTVLSDLSDVTAIAVGGNHSLALKSDGTVIAWGAIKDVPLNLTGVIKIAAGDGRNLAIRANGTVCEWNAPQCSP